MLRIPAFFVLFLSLIPCISYSQTISGFVYDEAENKPLEGAFVYLDGTTFSANTDAKGFFQLNAGEKISAALMVSYIGFETFRLENPFQYTKAIKVQLREDSTQLDEVVITKKPLFSRKEMLRVFRQQFLGESKSGSSCKIENEDDIRLYYDTSTNTLKAESVKPLRIINERLKYNLLFDLSGFRVSFSSKTLNRESMRQSFFAGTSFFKDVSVHGEADKRRKEAYLGSTVHFMKTLANNTWEQEKFKLYAGNFPASPYRYFSVKDTLGIKKVTVLHPDKPAIANVITISNPNSSSLLENNKIKNENTTFSLLYNGDQQSSFKADKGIFYVDQYGLFYPVEELIFWGYMGELKAGDLLPLDYKYVP